MPGWTNRCRTVTRPRTKHLAVALLLTVMLPTTGLGQAHPQRIVSVVPALTEALFAMGAGDQVVGVGSFDTIPPGIADLPRVGGLLDPDLEQILSLRPDLVVLYGSQSDQIEQLRRAGIATFSYVHGGLAHSISTLRRLGTRTGRTNEARQVVSTITSELARLSLLLRERRKPLVLLVFGRQPGSLRNVYASGGVGFLHDMLEAAGGRNVLADLPRESIQLTSEAILTSAAEVIIELTYDDGMTQNSQQAERAVWNELSAVPAVRNRRVYLMLGTHFVQPGPRLAEATEAIARILHPDVVP